MIDLEQAKLLAENNAMLEINWVPEQSFYLSDFYNERESCWIFFAKEDIPQPPEGVLRATAFAVSKSGVVRAVYDFRDNPEKMSAFADRMSDYFSTHDE